MIIAMWITLGVIVYLAGFIGTAAWEERTCPGAPQHNYCDHPWGTPLPLMWPMLLMIGVVAAPLWLVFGGAAKIAHKLAVLPTREERRDAREKRELEAQQARDEERADMLATIQRLERQLGVGTSND